MKIIKPILRLLLRLPYFYYWSWVKWPYNFELWLSFYVSPKLAHGQLDNLKPIVPKGYGEMLIKYPFISTKEYIALAQKHPGTNRVFYHYEDGEVKSSDKPGPPVTITINRKTPPEDPTDW